MASWVTARLVGEARCSAFNVVLAHSEAAFVSTEASADVSEMTDKVYRLVSLATRDKQKKIGWQARAGSTSVVGKAGHGVKAIHNYRYALRLLAVYSERSFSTRRGSRIGRETSM